MTINGVHCQVSAAAIDRIAQGISPRNEEGVCNHANWQSVRVTKPPVGCNMTFQATPTITGGLIKGSNSSVLQRVRKRIFAFSSTAIAIPTVNCTKLVGIAKSAVRISDQAKSLCKADTKLLRPTHEINGFPIVLFEIEVSTR